MSHGASQPSWSSPQIGLAGGKTAKVLGTLPAIQQLVAFALVRHIDRIIVELLRGSHVLTQRGAVFSLLQAPPG